MTSILIIILCILALAGLPIFALIGGVSIVLFSSIGQDMGLVMGDTYKIAITPGLLALPLFVFTGYLLSETNISNRILRFFTALLGRMPGGAAAVPSPCSPPTRLGPTGRVPPQACASGPR